MSALIQKTLSQIVTENYQAARVFEKYGLDFCCKGKRPLADACAEKNISTEEIEQELNSAMKTEKTGNDFNEMSLTELAEYIVRVHHTYVKLNMPQIQNYVLRVATKHGDRYPYMQEVYSLFADVQEELTQHMQKEERILFPRIKQLESFDAPVHAIDLLNGPISIMEEEHDRAGTVLAKIRELTNNYTAPENACTTFQLTLASLQAFELDLHQHVHLENNILFPKALKKLEEQHSLKLQ
jgi:regulator of cell morphogenesis and NO signaling